MLPCLTFLDDLPVLSDPGGFSTLVLWHLVVSTKPQDSTFGMITQQEAVARLSKPQVISSRRWNYWGGNGLWLVRSSSSGPCFHRLLTGIKTNIFIFYKLRRRSWLWNDLDNPSMPSGAL